ncbi:MAG TPA: RES family NAD+ phosphorylase [Solimonas sp.]|nr:RES family NAD+ phosphorylase [Solimonas sp.]
MAKARRPPITPIDWRPAWRIVPSRFPPVGLFDRVADADDLDAIAEIEGLTNPRLRDELGQLDLVARNRRITGAGATPIMAAFTHLNAEGSRFSDGTYGVLYAAHEEVTAIRETVYHRARFLACTREPPLRVEMRCYKTGIRGSLHDLRRGYRTEHDPDSYVASRALAHALRAEGSDGIVYRSVRNPGGECVAAFYPDIVLPHVQTRHYQYVWDGAAISDVLEMKAVKV